MSSAHHHNGDRAARRPHILCSIIADRCRRHTASCRVVVLRWTLKTIECQFLLHLLLHHLHSRCFPMDAEVSTFSASAFRGICQIIQDIMDILMSFERNLRYFYLVTQRWTLRYDINQTVVNVVFFKDLPEAIMPGTIECFIEVIETTKDLLRVFQIFFHQQLEVEYICSVVLIFDLKPACSSSKICSAWFTSLLRITHSVTLLGWLIMLSVL